MTGLSIISFTVWINWALKEREFAPSFPFKFRQALSAICYYMFTERVFVTINSEARTKRKVLQSSWVSWSKVSAQENVIGHLEKMNFDNVKFIRVQGKRENSERNVPGNFQNNCHDQIFSHY